MSFIFELIGEVVFEGILELTVNKAVTKWIRYPLIVLVFGFFSAIVIGLFLLGCKMAATQLLLAIILWAISALVAFGFFRFFEKKRRSR